MLLIQSGVCIILAQDHKSSFSQAFATCALPVTWHLPCQDPPLMLNPICVSQPCSLTEKKKGRVGSVVMPYILSSTLRRMSTASTLSSASSGLSSGSASSDGPVSSHEWVPVSSSHLQAFCSERSRFSSFYRGFVFRFGASGDSRTVPCCLALVIAGLRFCPALRKTTESLERTGRSGAWANPKCCWRGSQMQTR